MKLIITAITLLITLIKFSIGASTATLPMPTLDFSGNVRQQLINAYGNITPEAWGINLPGVKTKLATKEPVIALTFDACGVGTTDAYNSKLIEYLEKEQIPATLFVTWKWIDKNKDTFLKLAANPLFEIENHGKNHRPLSANGKMAYGIKGTKNVGEMYDEIEKNAWRIKKLTGRMPKYFRAGTDYYDEIGIKIVQTLSFEVVSFSVNGDRGATLPKEKIKERLVSAPPSSIILMHMNRPESQTLPGLMEAVPVMRKKGIRFVKLEDYPLK